MSPEVCVKCEKKPSQIKCSCRKHYCRVCHQSHCENFPTHHEYRSITEGITDWALGTALSLKDLFVKDERSKWFGIVYDKIDDAKITKLVQTPRFNELVSASAYHFGDSPNRQFPSIVSFVGETGAGKSTLSNTSSRNLLPPTSLTPLSP